MSVPFRFLAFVAGLVLLGGCATPPPPVLSYKPPVPPEGIVLVANGAGGNTEATRAFAAALQRTKSPLYVRTFEWTHGRGRGVADVVDVENAREQGRRLAHHIAWYRATYPDKPVYVVGFSAGTHVALEAMSWLGPNSVERLIIMAPAVSAEYDLRPALVAASQGVDVFYSERDQFYLGIGTGIVGTADGRRGVPPAGRVGFDMPPSSSKDVALLERLRQHPWDESVEWTGNTGTHAGSLSSKYLRAYVLPLLNAPKSELSERPK